MSTDTDPFRPWTWLEDMANWWASRSRPGWATDIRVCHLCGAKCAGALMWGSHFRLMHREQFDLLFHDYRRSQDT